jgi:hypothetical protein
MISATSIIPAHPNSLTGHAIRIMTVNVDPKL